MKKLAIFLCLFLFAFPAQAENENWIAFGDKKNGQNALSADCFYVYPTVIPSSVDGKMNVPTNDVFHRIAGKTIFDYQASVFKSSCNMYAPYYRQACLSAFAFPAAEAREFLNFAYQDVKAAFFEYLKASDKPFILAGHSQGAMLLSMLLSEFFVDEVLRGRLVAAYLFGMDITEKFMAENPHLKFAERADDFGVILTYNSRNPDVIAEDMHELLNDNARFRDSLTINPLNWKRDETHAPAELNLGSVFFHRRNDGGYDIEEVLKFADAQTDIANGVLLVRTVASDDRRVSLPGFPRGIYHGAEISLFYRNLEQNAHDRISAYFEK